MASDRTSEVLEEIRRIAATELELSRPIQPSDELVRDLQLDSMTMTILAVALEDRFRIKLSEEDAPALRTVEDLAHLVVRRRAEAAR